MKHLNFLSNLLSLSDGSQSSNIGYDCRLTVGSPSGRYCSGLMRLVFILAILLTVGVGNAWGADVTDVITASNLAATGTTYTDFSGVSITSDAVYAGQSAKDGSENIQLRSKNSNSGIVTTASGGNRVKSVKITVGSGSNTVDVYGKTSAYSGASDLYSSSTQGTKLGSVSATGTITVTGDYTYVGIRSNNGAIYLSSIEITWETGSSKTLSSISISTQPTTRKYLVGETFSSTGAVVTAYYSDETSANVSTSATWTPTTGLVSGSNTITASYTEGGVTRTATTTVTGYTVTVQVKDVDGNTLSGVGAPTASATGASITASASGNNYVFKRWVAVTAAGTSFANASNRSTTLTGTPTGNVTIKAEYYKPINITWNAGGSAYTPGTPGTTQVGYGTLMSSLTLPSPEPSTASYCGDKFVGWTTEEDVSQDDDTGLNLFTSVAGNSTEITEDMDFYAVFADYDE